MTSAEIQSQLADEACLVCFGISNLSDLLEISRLEILAIHTSPFDPAACAVLDLVGGGGNTFECYDDGDYSNSMQTSGTGMTELFVANSNYGPFGDTFESYAVGAYSGGTPGASASGLITIFVGNGP